MLHPLATALRLVDARLTPTDKLALIALCDNVGDEEGNGRIFPGTLAAVTMVSDYDRLAAILAALDHCGYLEWSDHDLVDGGLIWYRVTL